jgi:transketolase
MVHASGASHVGSCFSVAELLAVLYSDVLRVDPFCPDWPDRDRFILSKGHACAALYAVLADKGFFPAEWLDGFYRDGTRLPGHVTHRDIPGVETSTGSLGHGLSLGCGMALCGKRDQRDFRVIVLLSDGECDEGSVWEAALFAPHHRLDNLTVIVDYNKIQSLGTTDAVLNLEPLAAKWAAFGWEVVEIDGHNIVEIAKSLTAGPIARGRPRCVVAHTTKGKGVSFMENSILWHYRAPNQTELMEALAELDGAL